MTSSAVTQFMRKRLFLTNIFESEKDFRHEAFLRHLQQGCIFCLFVFGNFNNKLRQNDLPVVFLVLLILSYLLAHVTLFLPDTLHLLTQLLSHLVILLHLTQDRAQISLQAKIQCKKQLMALGFDPRRVFLDPSRVFLDPSRFFLNPSRIFLTLAIYLNPCRIFFDTSTVFLDTSRVFLDPSRVFLIQCKNNCNNTN